MTSCRRNLCLAVIAATVVLAADRAAAQSIGCARMPSRVPQYFGYGYGAGHHAPMVRTPGYPTPHVKHITFVPAYCGSLAPAAYETVRCYGDDCYIGGRLMTAPTAPPSPETAPPSDRQARRLFEY